MRYWIRSNKRTLGPYSPDDIRRQPGLTEDTLVCPEGSSRAADWRRLQEVPELLAALRGLPAPPAAAEAASPPALRDRKDLAKLIIRALGGSIKRK